MPGLSTVRGSFRAAMGAAAFLAFTAAPAMAQQDVGTRIKEAMTDMVGPLLFALAIAASLCGVVMLAKGLLKFREASNGQGATGSAFVHLFAGAMLIMLPEASGAGLGSLLGQSSFFGLGTSELSTASRVLDGTDANNRSFQVSNRLSGMATVKAPDDCINQTDAVPCMAGNVAKNVVPVGIIAAFAVVYVAGLWGFASALFELARHSGERGGAGGPPGFWTKIIGSILMLGAPPIFMAVTKTVLGDQNVIGLNGLETGSNLLTYTLAGANIFEQYSKLIGYLFTIAALFGVVAFCRGLFILKGAAEQRGNATYGHSIVYLVCGTLLANAKLSTCTILSTLSGVGGANMVGFCN